jgi:hypothetical protein
MVCNVNESSQIILEHRLNLQSSQELIALPSNFMHLRKDFNSWGDATLVCATISGQGYLSKLRALASCPVFLVDVLNKLIKDKNNLFWVVAISQFTCENGSDSIEALEVVIVIGNRN